MRYPSLFLIMAALAAPCPAFAHDAEGVDHTHGDDGTITVHAQQPPATVTVDTAQTPTQAAALDDANDQQRGGQDTPFGLGRLRGGFGFPAHTDLRGAGGLVVGRDADHMPGAVNPDIADAFIGAAERVAPEHRATFRAFGLFLTKQKEVAANPAETQGAGDASEIPVQLAGAGTPELSSRRERYRRDGGTLTDALEAISPEVYAADPELRRNATVIATELVRTSNKDTPELNANAQRIVNRVVAADPDDAGARNVRASARYGLGDYNAAREDADYILARDENNQRAYTTRALAAYQQRDYAQALADAKRALALNKNNKVAYQVAKLSAGRVTTADELGLDSVSKAAAEQVATEFEAQERQRAQVEAMVAKSAPPAKTPASAPRDKMLDSLNAKALHKIRLNDPQGAKFYTNKVLDRQPDNVDALYARAVAENLMGNYPHAVEDATHVLHLDPKHAHALDARAQALVNLKRYHEAARDADASIAIDVKNPYAYINRAKAKEHLGDIAGMIADYKAAAKLSPQFSDELRAVARKYNLPLATAGAVKGVREAAAEKTTNRRFGAVLISSISGGLLIAFGLLQVMRPGRKRGAAVPGASPETQAALAGIGLAGYDQVKVLGQGGMGVVFEAYDRALDRKVAVKKMRDEIRLNDAERKRFLQEARLVAKLSHPNIVSIHNIVEDHNELYMIFEHVQGKTLDELIAKKGKLSPKECAFIMRGICHALAYAHAKGVIHRDLKPSNIMITDEGMVKVMDFGIARQAADAMAASTQTQTVAGTPQYMAPEQDQGVVRKESDIFALTACFYELLTGRRPFPNPTTTASKLNKQYERPSRVTGGLPPEVDAFIDQGLEPDPDKRIRTAQDFLARLEALNLPAALPRG